MERNKIAHGMDVEGKKARQTFICGIAIRYSWAMILSFQMLVLLSIAEDGSERGREKKKTNHLPRVNIVVFIILEFKQIPN
jgi:hypothetical protein